MHSVLQDLSMYSKILCTVQKLLNKQVNVARVWKDSTMPEEGGLGSEARFCYHYYLSTDGLWSQR